MKKNLLLISFILITAGASRAQTFNGVGGVIHDFHGTAIPEYYNCTVSGLPTAINSSFGLERICMNILHTYDGDIQVKLMSPDGFMVVLSDRRGGSGDNFIGTCFRGQSINGMISNGTPPFGGEFDPDGNLSTFMNGRNPNGTWSLIVTDYAAVDSGSVNSFSLVFSSNPSPASAVPCSTVDATLCQCPGGVADCDLLPDMTASAAALLNGSYESHDTVYINNATPNIGWGPLEIHGINSCWCGNVQVPCSTAQCPGTGLPPEQLVQQTIYHKNSNGVMTSWTRPAGTMTYHPSHGHIHVDNWAAYTLRRPVYGLSAPDWPIIGTGSKTSFCLINLGQCTTGGGYCLDTAGNALGPVQISNYGLGAVTGCATDQGIYVGNYDVYSAGLSGQWIIMHSIDSICNGTYSIVSITDPDNAFLETNENNNYATSSITLTHQLSRPFPTVNFTYSGPANILTFNNTSSDYDSLLWDFGDGTTSTASNPVHSYSNTGSYTVVLTAFNHCGFEQRVESFTITLVGVFSSAIQDVFGIKVYPNPAETQVKIDFSLSKRCPVLLQLFDAMGNLVKTMADETMNMGSHHYVVDASIMNLSKGVYNIRLTSSETNVTKRIVFVK